MPEAQTGPALDPEKMEGQEIGGCKITQKIATGGMGTVYKALQVSMSRQVAIKCLAEDFAKDQQYVQRFVREARAAGELSHTNLIHVMDVGVFQGVYFYIMEFVDGQSLDRILRIKEKLGPETVVEILLQSARALSYAHSHDIIHRDIKPDNLMITKEGTVKIADLGIAKKMDRSREATDAGLVLGTPNYMAPEQATDAALTDRRSDIYCLGSTVYHMLSGKPPYTGKNALEILTSVVKRKPEPIEKLRPDLPKHLLQIINKMMARDPERRYQSMDELVKDVELYKAGKYKSEKPSTRTSFEDDEEEAAKPKVKLELAGSLDEETLKHSGVAPPGTQAAGSASTDGVKLSGTRVAPGGAPVLDLVGAKALGAINAKKQSKLIPILTLVGGLAILGIGWKVMKAMTAPKQKENTGPSRTTELTPIGPTKAPGEDEAKALFADAETMERRGGTPRAEVIRGVREIADRYPETVAGHNAAEKEKKLEAEWQEAVGSRLAEAQKKLGAMAEVEDMSPAVDATKRARQEAQGRADLVEKVRAVEKEIDAAAWARQTKLMEKARQTAREQRWRDAMDTAAQVFALKYEAPKFDEVPIKSIAEWWGKWRDERDLAIQSLDQTLEKAREKFRGSDDPKVEMLPDRAAELAAAFAKDPKSLSIRPEAEHIAAVYHDAALVVTAAWDQVAAMKGQKFKFSKEAFANNQPVEIVEPQRPLVQVKYGAQTIRTKPLTHEDIWNLANLSLGATQEGKTKLACYLFARGNFAEALKLAASAGGEPAEKLVARIEDLQIRAKELKIKPRDLILNAGGAWNDQAVRGAWTLRENGSEIQASGDAAEKLLTDAPEADYIFEAEARKELGPNGFIVFFKAMGVSYQWHIGDNGNKMSIVRGVPSTQTGDVMRPGEPLLVRVVVLADRAIGYINGERRWQINRTTTGNPVAAPGTGLGVVFTLVRFRKLLLWDLK
ncbi:MAG: protein kinase [Planctomycetia bacterium]|nr:protein kinase [Planctomycetia bacterium]